MKFRSFGGFWRILTVLSLGGCTSSVIGPDGVPISMAEMHQARYCSVSPIKFTNRDFSAPIPVHMTASSDGWCWISLITRVGSFPTTGEYTSVVQEQPSHGHVVVFSDGGENRFAYKPIDAYVGSDHMVISLYSKRDYVLDTDISVVHQ